MANTQVFTLGLGVTVINPLGQAIDLLRRDVERLRRQADGTRLGRLVGEVIRLGLELGKVRQVERQLALDQEQQYEEQIARLGDEAESVERLRQHYLMLDRVIDRLARLKPFKASLTLSTIRSSNTVVREARSTAANQQPDAAAPAKAASPELEVSLARGALVAAGLGLTALAGRRVARAVVRKQPRNTQRRIARVASKEWQAHRVDAIGSVGKALVEGESGEQKAQGVGAALGKMGGRMLGAVLPRLTKSRLARRHGAKAGAYLGDAVGKLLGGKLYAWVTQDARTQPGAGAAPASAEAQAAGPLAAEQAQQLPQLAMTRGALVAAGLGLTALGGRRVARAVVRKQPRNTQRRIARVAGKEWQAHRVDAIGSVGKALVEGESGEEKAQGVGAALGNMGGRMLGAVLPRLTKSRLARRHGAKAGAYLGDAVGKSLGGKLYTWVTQDVRTQPGAGAAPASAEAQAAGPVAAEQAQQPPQLAMTRGALVAAGLGLTALGGRRVARAVVRKQPRNTQRRLARVASQEWQANRVDAIGALGKALVEGESGEEKAQGVGAALGNIGGRMLGAVLPRLTKSRLARKHGAKAGAYLGEAFGEMAGGGLFKWVTQPRHSEPPAAQAPEAQEQGDVAATPPKAQPMPETGAAQALGLPSLLKESAGIRLPGIGKLLKKVPGAALLDASLQVMDTYNSDGTPARKMESYGSAAGGLGGTLAGAAAGAAIGSVVPVIGTAIGGLIGGVLGGMGGESAGGLLGRAMASITGNGEPGQGKNAAEQPGQLMPVQASTALSVPASGQPSQPVNPPTLNQQFTFTANMPVTFNNSLDDPTTLQQLETIARRMLDDLMRQARSVQMADQPQP